MSLLKYKKNSKPKAEKKKMRTVIRGRTKNYIQNYMKYFYKEKSVNIYFKL